MNFTWFAGSNFLLSVILSHQPFSLVNGFNLLLQGDIGLSCLLCTSHASGMAVPCDLGAEGNKTNLYI